MTVKMWVYEGLVVNFVKNTISLAKDLHIYNMEDGKLFIHTLDSGVQVAFLVDETDRKPFAVYFDSSKPLGYNDNNFLNLYLDEREWELSDGVAEKWRS